LNFIDLGLSEPILDGLRDVGFNAPTKIQYESILPVLSGRDIIASSETGTGKTGAFVVPILELLSKVPQVGVRCLILTPTRELANQIDEQVTVIGYYSGITSATVFGGTDGTEFGVQDRALRTDGANIIIATPGRLLDHIKMGHVDFSKVEYLVLDEADRMLDMGFMPDVKKIVSELPEKKQNILFSATIPDTLDHFFKAITNDAVRVDCSVARTASGVRQIVYKISEEIRDEVIVTAVGAEDVTSAIVFTRTKRDADLVYKRLSKAGISVGVIHGDREQAEREMTLAGFKSGKIKAIVATDVLARGIDVDDVSHVFNYQIPNEPEDYIHRIGRTGRADAKGTAVTLVAPKDLRAFDRIKKHVKTEIEELLPEGYSEESLNELFNSVKGHSGRKNDHRSGGQQRKAHGTHHKAETTTDLEMAKALLAQPVSTASEHDPKQFIRSSKTTRKEVHHDPKATQDEENLNHEESILTNTTEVVEKVKSSKPKKRAKKIAERTSDSEESTDSVVSKSESKQGKKAKLLVKRADLVRKQEDEKAKPESFVKKVLSFFGIGKSKK